MGKCLLEDKIMKKIVLFIFSIFMLVQTLDAQWLGWRRLIDKPTFDVTANPLNWNTIYAGGEGRLVFRSYDGGLNWDTLVVDYRFGSVMFNNVVLHPRDTNIVIVGGLKFGVVERSTDNGENWQIALSTTGSLELNGKSLMLKPDAPDTIYLGEYRSGIIWRSINKGASWDSLSTVRTWRKWRTGENTYKDTLINVTVGATSIREDSTNILLVGTTTGEMFISQDGGLTWNMTSVLRRPIYDWTDCEITRIDFSNTNPRYGVACITYLFPKNKENGGLFKTTDGGYNWTEIAFHDTSLWATAVRGYQGEQEIFAGGYTEDFYAHDTSRVPGVGIVRRSQDGGNTWWVYDPHIDWAMKDPRSNSFLCSMYFRPNSDTAYSCGTYGMIYKTTDAGENWNNVIFPYQQHLRDIQFLDNKIGYVVGDKGIMYYSKNGAYQWTTVTTNVTENLNGLYFLDKKTGYVCGDNGTIIYTNDSAVTFNKLNSGTSEKLTKIFFPDAQTGYISGSNGTFMKSTDGGNSWTAKNTNTNFTIKSFDLLNSSTIIAVGDSALYLTSTDGGENWTKSLPGKFVNYTDITVADASKGIVYMCGDSGLVLKSTDGGSSWVQQVTNTYRIINSISFANADTGAICSKFGTVLQTTNGGNLWDIKKWNGGYWANMWSLRFWGPPGAEKLYMATEAGLFVLDYPSYVEQLKNNDKDDNLFTFREPGGNLTYRYRTDADLSGEYVTVSMFSLSGQNVFSERIMLQGTELYGFVPVSNLAKGLYLFRLDMNGKSCSRKIIID